VNDRIIRLPEVLARAGLGRSTLYAMMERGEFVRPVRLGARAVGWRESEVADWLAARPRTDA
jgi:prophage regulatory protein